MLRDAVGLPPVDLTGCVTDRPRLTESWFCCAEPTDTQLKAVTTMTDVNDFNQQMIEQFHANGGRLEFGAVSLLLLTTTGREERTHATSRRSPCSTTTVAST